MNITRVKGTKDIFFDEMKIREYINENIKDICLKHNINKIRTPIFEDTNLFSRGVGNETDIVNKEMYTFEDKGGRSLTLRPELTAGIVRAYIENGFSSRPSPTKLWYLGTAYRYEKMQKGRYREFGQFGIEILGSNSYLADIEVITIAYELFKRLNLLDKIDLNINSIGCINCREEYVDKLKEYLLNKIDNMCDDCKTRYIKNPMRIIDCKQDNCKLINKNIPMITDYLCNDCNIDFNNIKTTLNDIGIKYTVDKTIVRGLDYYNKTVFEFVPKDKGLALGGGGRYDSLVKLLGGNDTPAVGVGLGIDRIVLLLKENKLFNLKNDIDIYFITTNENSYTKLFSTMKELRDLGYIVDIDICSRSFNAQLKYANKINATYICIVGEDELKDNMCILKDMDNAKQIKINLSSNDIDNIIKGGVKL